MKLTRRSFLLSCGTLGATGAGGLLPRFLGIDLSPSTAYAKTAAAKSGKVTTSICPYCASGCGILVTAADGKVVNVEGDPDHPINQGSLCSKGVSLLQLANNDRRMSKVLYRAPGASAWEEKSWDWAMKKIAANIKGTRDATFRQRDDKDRIVNRTEGIACMGGAALDNEECYAYSKLARALGIVYLEHQARL